MNPRVLNPDPLAILKESNKIDDPRKVKPINDGFKIVDGGKAIDGTKPPSGGFSSDAEFDSSLKKNFDFTADNFKEAKLKSAREGKPLVVVFGNKNSQDMKAFMDNTIPGAKAGEWPAVYVFADRSKLDPNSELGKYAANNIAANAVRPYTAVFATKPGADGQPMVDNHLANFWGARGELSTTLALQVGSAKALMEARQTAYGKPEAQAPGSDTATPKGDQRPEAGDTRKLEGEAEARLNPIAKTVFESMKGLKGAKDYDQREGLYKDAEDAASKVDPKDIRLVQQKTAREMQEELAKGNGADPKKIDALKQKAQVVELLSTSQSWTKLNHGLSLMHFSQLGKGVEKIREGAKLNPEMVNNPRFIEQVMATPYNLDNLKAKLPEIKFDEYLQAKKDGKLDEFVAKYKPKEQPRPEAQPQPTDRIAQQPQKLKYDGTEFQKGLEDAYNSGRNYVVKVGSKDCSGCKEMEDGSWPDARVKKLLQEKAVMNAVDGEVSPDAIAAVEAMDWKKPPADAADKKIKGWPSISVIEPYKDPVDGKIKGRIVDRIEPNTVDARNADSLTGFLDRNLTAPKPPEGSRPSDQPNRPSDKPQVQIDPEDKAAFDRLGQAQMKVLEPLSQLTEQSDSKAVLTALDSSITEAHKIAPADLQRAAKFLQARQQAVMSGVKDGAIDEATKLELAKIQTGMDLVQGLDQAEASMLVERGIVKLTNDKANPEAGKKDVAEGLKLRPQLNENPATAERLKSTGYDANQLKQWFPSVKFGGEAPVKPEANRPDVKPEGQPEATDKRLVPTPEQKAALERLQTAFQGYTAPLKTLTQDSDAATIDKAFEEAIKKAPVKADDVAKASEFLSGRLQATLEAQKAGKATDQEVQNVRNDLALVGVIDRAEANLNISRGTLRLKMNKDNPEPGKTDIRNGLALKKELANDPAVLAKLSSTGYDAQTLKQWFPELPLAADQPEQPVKPEAQPQPAPNGQEQVFNRLRDQHARNLQPFAELGENPTPDKIAQAFDNALASAKQVDPKDVQLALRLLEQEKAPLKQIQGALSPDQQKQLDDINRDIVSYSRIGDAEGHILVERGAWKLKNNQANPQDGINDIKKGLLTHPNIDSDPKVWQTLKSTGYDAKQLVGMFPQLMRNKDAAREAAGMPAQGGRPADATPQPGADRPQAGSDVKPSKIKYDGADYQTALEDAFNANRRMVLKFGTPPCSDCTWMTQNSWPDKRVQKTLENDGVFVDIDGLKQKDLDKQYDARPWPKVIVVEPYKDESGQIKTREIARMEPTGKTQEEREASMGPVALNKFLTDNLTRKTQRRPVPGRR